MAQTVRGKFDLDVVGHDSRPDIFQLQVDERVKRPVTSIPDDASTSLENIPDILHPGASGSKD